MNNRLYRILLLVAVIFAALHAEAKVKRVLAIGNSFSVDAVEQNLWNLANADGEEMIIGNMYIPGCSIAQHVGCINKNSSRYSYRKIGLDGTRREIRKFTIDKALRDEPWDVITVQQVSDMSGDYNTYAKLSELIQYIREHTSPDVKIVFHQTWAYSRTSKHPGFPNYQSSQVLMYNSILSATKSVMHDYPQICAIIPCGVAIQLARTTFMGDTMTRDGYHLSSTGRYTVACTWYETLFGKTVIGNTFFPQNLTKDQAEQCQWAAHQAQQKNILK